MKTLTMPSFGADMIKAEIAHWNIKVGDKVKKGDIIASIETMKGLIDMEVFDDGVIEKLLIDVGVELAVGQPIAELRLAVEPTTEVKPNTNIHTNINTNPNLNIMSDKVTNKVTRAKTPNATAIKISPAARRKAEASGIDWRQLSHGQGPQGAIVLADIEQLTEESVKSTQVNTSEQDKSSLAETMRQAISGVVSVSKREIPHYYLQMDVLLDNAQHCLTQHNQTLPSDQRILLNAIIYCAVARALMKFPDFNGFYQHGHFESAKSVHLGNVINLRQGGLIVAAINDAEQLGGVEMMKRIKDQVIRARDGRLRMSELQNSTVTVSNLGERGCDSIQSIIFPPQVAIIGIGRPRRMPWIVDEKLTIAYIASLTLAADHRVSDGHSGARLLNKINSLLQKPESLL